MDALRLVLRYAHLIGFAVLLGGSIAQYLSGRIRINPAMLYGAGAQVVTGLALAAPLPRDHQPDPVKLAGPAPAGISTAVNGSTESPVAGDHRYRRL